MSDHLTRKELKQDQVALRVEWTFDYFMAHRRNVLRIGGAVLALIAIVAASIYYLNYQRDVRQQLLATALTLQNATVGATAPANGAPSFPTEAAKRNAVVTAYTKLMTEHGGSQEAYVAEYSLAAMDMDAGKTSEARRKYQDVADHAGANYSSLAKLALAQLDFAENKNIEAQNILKQLVDHPTDLVSKNQAIIALAKGLAATQPEEARKLLLPIASSQSEVSQVAVAALSDLPRK